MQIQRPSLLSTAVTRYFLPLEKRKTLDLIFLTNITLSVETSDCFLTFHTNHVNWLIYDRERNDRK